jgi:hypothetical protein
MNDIMIKSHRTTSQEQQDTFKIIHTESILNKAEFNRFINWVSAEYELYLQDNQNGLKIYFPGICLQISEKTYKNNLLIFEIKIQSKYEKNGIQISNQVLSILNHLKHFIC